MKSSIWLNQIGDGTIKTEAFGGIITSNVLWNTFMFLICRKHQTGLPEIIKLLIKWKEKSKKINWY